MKTNNLTYKTNKVKGNKHIFVKIRLNDQCKNGHQDFAITADIYEAGKPKIDKYHISGGCCHEDILKAYPEFKQFVDLHLCDYAGIPMHAGANGFYHLRNGFNNTPIESLNFKSEFCEYYRVTPSQFDELSKTKNVLQYSLALQNLGILKQWQEEANKAILTLEKLTGDEFINDSKKSQFIEPTPEAIKEEEAKQDNGYYTPEAEKKRELEKQTKEIEKLEAERDKEIKKARTEFEVKKQVLILGGTAALKNCIFYNHSQTLSFNWRSYDKISDELIKKITDSIKLPKGVTIETKN